MTKGNYFLRKEPVGSQSKDKKSKPSVTWGSFLGKFLFLKRGSPVYIHVYSVICYVNLLCSWAVLHILLSLMFLLTYGEKGANRITIFCQLFPVFFEETTITRKELQSWSNGYKMFCELQNDYRRLERHVWTFYELLITL